MTGLIGEKCTHRKVFSLLVLIGRSYGEQRSGTLECIICLNQRIFYEEVLRQTANWIIPYVQLLEA